MRQRELFLLFPLSQVLWVYQWNPVSTVWMINSKNIINIQMYMKVRLRALASGFFLVFYKFLYKVSLIGVQ